MKHSYNALSAKESPHKQAFILSLKISHHDYDEQRLRRLTDAASVFLVFEQACTILLDLNVLQYTSKDRIVKDIKALGEFGLKKLTFFSAPKHSESAQTTISNRSSQEQRFDSLAYVVAQLNASNIECHILEHHQSEHSAHKSVSF